MLMQYLKISLGIFFTLAASRFIPHPPNFTSLIALSFYVPALLGIIYTPALILSFMITDLIIGFHKITFFTWGSVIFISLISQFFKSYIHKRIFGVLMGALLFFVITNFGVWSFGYYGYDLTGLVECYIVALPFFGNTIVSTILFSALIELIYNRFSFKFRNL